MEIEKINMEDAGMQFSPKLKKAKEEIMEILKKHDIGAMFVLHTPGHGEYVMHVDTTYSCAKFDGTELRVKARIKEDFNGDRKAWTKKIGDTVNMLQTYHDVGMMLLENNAAILSMVSKKVEIVDLPGGSTSHEAQMN